MKGSLKAEGYILKDGVFWISGKEDYSRGKTIEELVGLKKRWNSKVKKL